MTTGEPNHGLLRSLVSATKAAYRIVGAVALLLAVTAGTMHVQNALQADSLLDRQLVSWWIYVAAIWVNTSMAYWNPLLRGIGAVAESGQANVAGKVAQLALTSAALLLGYGLTGVAASYLASTFVFRLMSRRFFHRRSELNERTTYAEGRVQTRMQLLTIIWPNTFRQGVVSLSQYVMTWSPVLVASSFFSLQTAATVGLTVQVVGIVKVFGNALYNAFLPQFSSLRLNGDLGQLRNRLALVLGVASYAILGIGTVSLVAGPPLLHLLGTEVHLLALAPGVFFLASEWAVNQSALVSGYLSTANKVPMHKAYFVAAAVGTVGQILAATYFDWGIWGVVLPPLVASLMYNDWVWFRRAAADLKIPSARLLAGSVVEPYALLSRRLGGH